MAVKMLKEEEMNMCREVMQIYEKISKLESLKPSRSVNALLTRLVGLCTLPCSAEMDVRKLGKDVEEKRRHLIELCGEAEGHMEHHYAGVLLEHHSSLSPSTLPIFPYYKKLAALEYAMVCEGASSSWVKRVAFVGSGPLPLTSIVLAMHHLKSAAFDNYDIDAGANNVASKLVRSHNEYDSSLSQRMSFITCDILRVGGERLGRYDVVFVAALVGLRREEKMEVLKHIGKHIKSGALVVIRRTRGGRAFLYPVVDEEDVVTHSGLRLLSVVHPTNEVINSILLAQKP
ncbi:hypothetical protein SUGI_0848990 [Cryptomeria japonica]|uniref:probable nicotianamine synthase 4 n=1 Tax=Cryptomeria japonica TaxID=3369 RepID=UPI0024148B0E|nr:probable nicotianamine synthase 4 [Cryptomeria japonica]GLJ41008.1 hypothetical protein SUGI_0848990 [Cryptomeria japonica]